MKKTTLLLALLTLPAVAGLAQAAKGGPVLVEAQTLKEPAPEKKPAIIPPKTTNEILGQRVFYGGYLTDFKRAEKKRPLFSLRTPIDPQKDTENLSYYPGTDKIQGVILFSIKF